MTTRHSESWFVFRAPLPEGVSGRVAQAIAEKMQSIAQHHQLLCITHLAQVAASADQHLYIEKVVENERAHYPRAGIEVRRKVIPRQHDVW